MNHRLSMNIHRRGRLSRTRQDISQTRFSPTRKTRARRSFSPRGEEAIFRKFETYQSLRSHSMNAKLPAETRGVCTRH